MLQKQLRLVVLLLIVAALFGNAVAVVVDAVAGVADETHFASCMTAVFTSSLV